MTCVLKFSPFLPKSHEVLITNDFSQSVKTAFSPSYFEIAYLESGFGLSSSI